MQIHIRGALKRNAEIISKKNKIINVCIRKHLQKILNPLTLYEFVVFVAAAAVVVVAFAAFLPSPKPAALINI